MQCKVCGREIARGERFKSPVFTSLPFCSETCANAYAEEHNGNGRPRKRTDFTKLTDLLANLYLDDGFEPDFRMLGKQIQNFKKLHKCEDKDIGQMIRYAIDFEQFRFSGNYGLMQFDRFYDKFLRFKDELAHSKAVASEMEEDKIVSMTSGKKERYLGFKVDLDNI